MRVKLTDEERKEIRRAKSRRHYAKVKADPVAYAIFLEKQRQRCHTTLFKEKRKEKRKAEYWKMKADPVAHARVKNNHLKYYYKLKADPTTLAALKEKQGRYAMKAFASQKQLKLQLGLLTLQLGLNKQAAYYG